MPRAGEDYNGNCNGIAENFLHAGPSVVSDAWNGHPAGSPPAGKHLLLLIDQAF
jgi:hypothetical protein